VLIKFWGKRLRSLQVVMQKTGWIQYFWKYLGQFWQN